MLQRAIQHSVQLIPWRLRAMIKRVPVVAPLQRWLLSVAMEGREFVHTVNAGPAKGLKTIVVLPADKGVWTGTYELDFVKSLAAAIRPDDVCFDVGGWHGFCGGVMAMNGASQTVIFEPMPVNCDRIRRLVELNPDLNMRLIEGAAGEEDGTATFVVSEADSMGKLQQSRFQQEVSGHMSIEVPIVSLDTWCERQGMPMPNVMKIDVEGAEAMVLRGAIRILTESRPILFVEAHSRELAAEVVSLLRPLRYDITTLETGRRPDGNSEPEVCHLVARPGK